jgi:type IV pilus assembly protein PilK
MPALKLQSEDRPPLGLAESDAWRELIEQRCGIYFSEARTHQLESALRKRMEKAGIASFAQYYRSAASAREWPELLEAVTNHETCFFRHAPTFRALGGDLLPAIAKAAPPGTKAEASLWSAGCSTGEEAYSAAMVAHEVWGRYPWLRCSILASDISDIALDTAAQGRYGSRAASDVPPAFRAYLTARPGDKATPWEVAAEVKARLRWSKVNLVEIDTYPQEQFDVILCQNVFVYFRTPAAQKVLNGLASRLKPGGCLLPGPGEIAGLDWGALRCVSLGDVQIFLKQSAARA